VKAIAIIAASGAGKRMRLPGGGSKQLLEIGGFPVIHHTLRAFEESELVGEVYVATKAGSIELLREMARQAGFSKVRHVIEGGAERQDSVGNCVRAIALRGTPCEAILVHDGARPFIRPREIDEIVRLSLESGACVPANRPKDTIKFVGDDPRFFGPTLDRSRLLQVQTPQGFRSGLLVEAHTKAAEEGWYATDDAALVERYFPENPVRIYETGYHNIKITTPEDIGIAEAIHRSLREEQ